MLSTIGIHSLVEQGESTLLPEIMTLHNNNFLLYLIKSVKMVNTYN